MAGSHAEPLRGTGARRTFSASATLASEWNRISRQGRGAALLARRYQYRADEKGYPAWDGEERAIGRGNGDPEREKR